MMMPDPGKADVAKRLYERARDAVDGHDNDDLVNGRLTAEEWNVIMGALLHHEIYCRTGKHEDLIDAEKEGRVHGPMSRKDTEHVVKLYGLLDEQKRSRESCLSAPVFSVSWPGYLMKLEGADAESIRSILVGHYDRRIVHFERDIEARGFSAR